MVTLNPAKQLGIDNRVGSIEVGKDADLVIYDKFPLSDYAKVQKVLIDGTVYFDRDNEVSGRSAKQAEKQKLIDKEKQTARSAGRARAGGLDNEISRNSIRLAPSRCAADTVFIRNVDVYPVTGAEMKGVSVVLQDGKIAEIGAKIVPPKGARIIEGKGLRVYPGMIDSGTELGLSRSLRGARDGGYRRDSASSCRSCARSARSIRRANTSAWSASTASPA